MFESLMANNVFLVILMILIVFITYKIGKKLFLISLVLITLYIIYTTII